MLNQDYTAKILNLEDVIITNVENISNQLHVYIELPRSEHICPACGAVTDRVHDYRMQTVKDVPLARETFLHLRKRRYRYSCGKQFFEKTYSCLAITGQGCNDKTKVPKGPALVCVTSATLETGYFTVIHKNRAGARSDTIHDFSYFASAPTIDIEPSIIGGFLFLSISRTFSASPA